MIQKTESTRIPWREDKCDSSGKLTLESLRVFDMAEKDEHIFWIQLSVSVLTLEKKSEWCFRWSQNSTKVDAATNVVSEANTVKEMAE